METLNFTSFLFAYCNIRREALLDGLAVSTICIASSWTLMVATLKNGGSHEKLVPRAGGRIRTTTGKTGQGSVSGDNLSHVGVIARFLIVCAEGWLIRHARQNTTAHAVLFGLPDLHLLVKVLQYTPGGSILFHVHPRVLTPLWAAYYGRAIYGLIELVTCLYSISRLDTPKPAASDQ